MLDERHDQRHDQANGIELLARAQSAALTPSGLDEAVAAVAVWAATAPAGLVELHLGRWAADRRVGLRLLAVRSVALAGGEARRALLALLGTDARRDVRRLAAVEFVALADLDRPDDLEQLRALLLEPDDALAAGVAEQLVARVAGWDAASGGSADGSLAGLVAPLLASRAVKARTAVLRGLGGWRPGSPLALPDVVAQITSGLADEAGPVRQAAAKALADLAATIPAQGWALVRRLHAGASPRTRALLERQCIAGALAGGLTRDEAWTWATEPEQRTRRALALALRSGAERDSGGRNWHRDLLRHLSVDPVPAVRAAALDAARSFATEAWAARAAQRNAGSGSRAVAEAAQRLAKAVRTRQKAS